jgi:hypothetical protein
MPRSDAHIYLEELGHSVNEVRGRERGRHVWHAVVASPGTLVTVWHGWLRERLVRLAVHALSRRVHQVQLLLRDAAAGPRRHRVALRRLRWYCRAILLATGGWQYHEYSGPARALLLSCRRSVEHGGGTEMDAQILREVKKLAGVLTKRSPDLA